MVSVVVFNLTMLSVVSYRSIMMSGLQCLAQEKIWFDKSKYDEAERRFYEGINGLPSAPQVPHYTQRKLAQVCSVTLVLADLNQADPCVNAAW